MAQRDEDRLKRLLHMHGSDEGFYLLAVHSFVEAWLREWFPGAGVSATMPQLIDAYRAHLQQHELGLEGTKSRRRGETSGWNRNAGCLSAFVRQQYLANSVRHHFAEVDREEVRAATSRLVQFCRLSGIDAPHIIDELGESVEKVWVGRGTPLEEMKELRRVGFELLRSQQKNKDLHRRIMEYEQALRDERSAGAEVERLEAELAQQRTRVKQKDERVDELRRSLAAQRETQRSLQRQIAELEPARDYLANLTRITTYARTRIDFERELTRLTDEQKRAVDAVSLHTDFLIKGSAGTGKTLVLLKALEKATLGKGGDSQTLPLGNGAPSVVLLTYTRTLVKYDRYIASLLNPDEPEQEISTADRYIASAMRSIGIDAEVDYHCLGEFTREYGEAGGLSPYELASELEEFVFSSLVSREEYLDEMIPRTGRGTRLNRAAREEVWGALEVITRRMREQRRVSKNYSRILLLDLLERAEHTEMVTHADFMFVDEVQDLAACDIAVLKSLTRRALVMAGDADQAIYGPGFAFRRAGVEITGRTRILRTNFRNSIQIHALAERFRHAGSLHQPDQDTTPEAYRFGPPPELYVDEDLNALSNTLRARIAVLADSLGYDYANICVLTPASRDVEVIAELLAEDGRPSIDLRQRTFRFSEAKSVRLSTLHSSKGLDFPVVILYLPAPPGMPGGYNEATGDRMVRNLLYVSMTRAMEHLSVITHPPVAGSPVADLVDAFEEAVGLPKGIA
ncbi:MAG: UvrD-helicase domain-containing protein [Spirochaetota bacterium]